MVNYRALRKKMGMTQVKLAKKVETSQATIHKIETWNDDSFRFAKFRILMLARAKGVIDEDLFLAETTQLLKKEIRL